MSAGEEDQRPDSLLGDLGNFASEVREVGACAPPAAQAEGSLVRRERVQAAKYARPLAGYAEAYGSTGRSMKNWISAGREKVPVDLPPLDQPEMMASWWRRCMKHRVPDKILRYEQEAQERARASVPAATVATVATAVEAAGVAPAGAGGVVVPAEAELPGMRLGMSADVGADEWLRQLRELADGQYRQMNIALEKQALKQYGQLRREWMDTVKALRAWEKDITKIQEGRGEVLRAKDVRSELAQVISAMGQSFFNGMLALVRELAPELPAVERRAKVLRHRDVIYAHLKGSRFKDVWLEAP